MAATATWANDHASRNIADMSPHTEYGRYEWLGIHRVQSNSQGLMKTQSGYGQYQLVAAWQVPLKNHGGLKEAHLESNDLPIFISVDIFIRCRKDKDCDPIFYSVLSVRYWSPLPGF